jgi:hypothetical protein
MTFRNPHKEKKGKTIKTSKIEMDAFDYPIFCFKNLNKDYHLDHCNDEQKKAFIEKIVKLSTMTWQDIEYTHRHGLGSEKISRSSINAAIPSFITEDVKFLLSLRFLGHRPFVGYRNRFIFHVIYIDKDFTLYPH